MKRNWDASSTNPKCLPPWCVKFWFSLSYECFFPEAIEEMSFLFLDGPRSVGSAMLCGVPHVLYDTDGITPMRQVVYRTLVTTEKDILRGELQLVIIPTVFLASLSAHCHHSPNCEGTSMFLLGIGWNFVPRLMYGVVYEYTYQRNVHMNVSREVNNLCCDAINWIIGPNWIVINAA